MNGMAVSAPPILKTLKTKDMIAKTILQQIGGKRFTAMTGSRDFIDMGNGLRMSLARNKTSANRLDIIYDEGADLYNMRFYRRTFSKKTFECKTKDIAVHEGIYFDMLEEMFTMVTGLYTGNGLRMSLARNKTSANRLDIIYDEGADLYNMRFYRRTFSKKTFECKTKDIAVHEGIYFDMLEEMFTMVTGLYTRF